MGLGEGRERGKEVREVGALDRESGLASAAVHSQGNQVPLSLGKAPHWLLLLASAS